MDDAIEFKRETVLNFLKKYDTSHPPVMPTRMGAMETLLAPGEDTASECKDTDNASPECTYYNSESGQVEGK